MKKTFILIFILFLGYINVHSQVLISLIFGDKLNNGGVEFGITGGENFGQISGLESTDYYNDWNLGFYFNLRLKESPWLIYTGVLVKSKLGTGLTQNDVQNLGLSTYPSLAGSYTQTMSTFIIPVFLKYRFKNRIHFEVGPQFGLAYKAFVDFDYEENGTTVSIEQNNKSDINRIDLGFGIGTGYRFNNKATGATIGLKYYHGFIDVYKNLSGTKNSALFLQIDIPIGAGDCAQQKKKEDARKKALKKAKKEQKKKNNTKKTSNRP